MSARGKARKRALDVLFEAEMRGQPALEVLEARIIQADPPVTSYAAALVRGVQAHRQRIDELLDGMAHDWRLERMPAVDRNILRIGAYELLWGDVPEAVAINEAVLLARDLSTDSSPAFVNGVLASVLAAKPGILATTEAASGREQDCPDVPAPGSSAIGDDVRPPC